MGQCSARTRDGELCRARAVKGYEVCRMHGAGPPEKRRRGRPRIHGVYARTVEPEEVATLKDLRALGAGLEEEVAVARLQLARALVWSAAERGTRCDGKHCPYELVDARLALVSRLAARCQRIAEAAFAQLEEEAWVTRIVEVIERRVTDPETRAAIVRDLEEAEV